MLRPKYERPTLLASVESWMSRIQLHPTHTVESVQRAVSDHAAESGAAVVGTVESYGELVGIIIADPSREEDIHAIGDRLRQFHYAIERGACNGEPARTDFYETHWAREER